MSVDVVVIGAGGFGREALDVLEAHNAATRSCRHQKSEFRVVGVVDDLPKQLNLTRLEKRDYRYLGTTDQIIEAFTPQRFVLAIGDPHIRREVDEKFVHAGWEAVTVIHPGAYLGSQSVLGEGNIICAGVQISTNIRFGRHVHINPNATVGHDVVLDDYVSVNPGAVISGEVTVRRETLIGAAAVILQGLDIGSSSTIGASACVVKDVAHSSTVVGVPASPIERMSSCSKWFRER